MMWYWGGAGIHWWAWLFATFVTVAFWGLVIWGVIMLVKGANAAARPPMAHHAIDDSPERILARRFAAGEIDEAEFDRRIDAVRRASSSGS